MERVMVVCRTHHFVTWVLFISLDGRVCTLQPGKLSWLAESLCTYIYYGSHLVCALNRHSWKCARICLRWIMPFSSFYTWNKTRSVEPKEHRCYLFCLIFFAARHIRKWMIIMDKWDAPFISVLIQVQAVAVIVVSAGSPSSRCLAELRPPRVLLHRGRQ